jgi:mannose-6-phosphate isomerase-like protein (cupin superfamily)
VEKPWGFELIWAETPDYTGKLLHVRAGEALSVHFHQNKDETLHLLSGRIRFLVGPSAEELCEVVVEEGDSIRVCPGTIHRMEAVTDCQVLEASTFHPEDVVRLEDRYGRAGGTAS